MFKALSPDERATWVQKAVADKARYEAEVANYVPPPGFDARGNAIIPPAPPAYSGLIDFEHAHPNLSTKPIKKVKCRDPHAPKRNLSAYLLYHNAMRCQFTAENPGMTFGQLSYHTSRVSLQVFSYLTRKYIAST